MDIFPPQIPKERIEEQWNNLCIVLKDAIKDYEDHDGVYPFYFIYHDKVYNENRKRLESNGFWTTNHIMNFKYVTAISWG